MIKEIINNYIERNDIKSYRVIPKYSNLEDWNNSKTISFGNSIAFIYEFRCIGIINNISTDLSKRFFKLMPETSIDTYIDYKNIINYKDVAGAIEANSDYISIHQNSVKLDYDLTDNIFSTIYQAYIKYYVLTPILK